MNIKIIKNNASSRSRGRHVNIKRISAPIDMLIFYVFVYVCFFFVACTPMYLWVSNYVSVSVLMILCVLWVDLHVFVPTCNLACTVMSPKFIHQRNKAKGTSGCKSVPQEPWDSDTDVWINKRAPQLNTISYGSKDEWTLLTHAESNSLDAKLAKIPQIERCVLLFFFFLRIRARLCVGGSTIYWMK